MTDLKQNDMETRQFRQRCAQIGARIRTLREAKGLSQAELGVQLSLGGDAVRKWEGGINIDSYAELVDLVRALGCTPNDLFIDIAEVPGPPERDVIKGLLEGVCLALGRPLEQAQPLAEAALEVLDNPSVRNTGSPLRDSARILAADAVRRNAPALIRRNMT
jgi:transcriptional regulator with XRE-family HTH domain